MTLHFLQQRNKSFKSKSFSIPNYIVLPFHFQVKVVQQTGSPLSTYISLPLLPRGFRCSLTSIMYSSISAKNGTETVLFQSLLKQSVLQKTSDQTRRSPATSCSRFPSYKAINLAD